MSDETKHAVERITNWLHWDFMIVPDDLLAAACNAYRSLRMMAWTKGNETLQRAAIQYVAAFHTKLAAWRATISARLTDRTSSGASRISGAWIVR